MDIVDLYLEHGDFRTAVRLSGLPMHIAHIKLRKAGVLKIYDLVFAVEYLKSISNILGYDFEECFELAYQKIKDLKGRWINGTFVKEEDLV